MASKDISAESTQPTIHAHHCLCSNLLFATTYDLSKCQQRASTSLDHAFILPCPRASQRNDIPGSGSESEREESSPEALRQMSDYTLLISLRVPAKQAPVVVRREDGFEKRWLLRCERCSLAVGYYLDRKQYEQDERDTQRGRRADVMYILPGATMSTDQMRDGWKPPNDIVDFGLGVS